MRIVSGQFGGIRLAALGKGDAGAHLRPTSDRVRESLFSMLSGGRFGDPVEGARVLDLFAGTGALGLEALSRGAGSVTFIENGRKARSLILENIAKCRAETNCSLIRSDATRLSKGTPHDLVFLDPPYGKGLGEKAIKAALNGDWIAPGTLIVWEENMAIAPQAGLEVLDTRRFGDTYITFLRASV